MWLAIIVLLIPIGILLDTMLKKYTYTNSYLNSLLAFIMLFGTNQYSSK